MAARKAKVGPQVERIEVWPNIERIAAERTQGIRRAWASGDEMDIIELVKYAYLQGLVDGYECGEVAARRPSGGSKP